VSSNGINEIFCELSVEIKCASAYLTQGKKKYKNSAIGLKNIIMYRPSPKLVHLIL
jgi:hypothetical protein